MAIAWDRSLETGNGMIDSQHKQLIKAIDDLMSACAQGKGREQIAATLKFLADYTDKHFGDEERLQQSTGYPDYAYHKKLHEGFKKTVADLGARLTKEGPTIALTGQINTNMGDWLIRHIKKEDVKVAMHVSRQGK
jgi:hemerythrin